MTTYRERALAAEAAVARVEALAASYERVVRKHRGMRDCGCEFTDCYDCGYWHECIHGGPRAAARGLRAALTGAKE